MKSNAKELIRVFVTLNIFVTIARSEYASALVDLEPLLTTKGRIVEALDKYIKLEVKRLDKIKRFSQDYDKLYKAASKNVDHFLSNPINSYLLVKRLTTDWKFVWNLVEGSESKALVYDMAEEEILPNDYDLEEAANAVIRLQETYLLNTTDLVKGEVAGLTGATELTASDCFELGMNAYNESDFDLAVLWFQESVDRLSEDEFQMVDKTNLLDYFSYSAFMVEDVELALKLTKDLNKINPHHPYVYKNLKFYQNELLKKEKESKDPNLKSAATKNKIKISLEEPPKGIIDPILIDVERYKKLCRGEQLRTPVQERKLKCRYTTNGSKYLLLQPAKEETLNLDPWIVAYHDVIRDHDIELLKEMSEHMLERATVLNITTGSLDFAKYRTSKSGWLPDSFHPRVKHISKMIGEITGLEMRTAEDLQMNKYGLGGHYLGHYDFRRPGEFDCFAKFGTGNRIATWLFYLSDVEAGGSTVFPELDVQIKPIKGSAGFWFNLFKSGEGDLRTKHAACPVIAGDKWEAMHIKLLLLLTCPYFMEGCCQSLRGVANKWLHERGQEFRRTCNLSPLHSSLKKFTV